MALAERLFSFGKATLSSDTNPVAPNSRTLIHQQNVIGRATLLKSRKHCSTEILTRSLKGGNLALLTFLWAPVHDRSGRTLC
ncbi:MAG: hypothetical protein ACRDS9_09695, partial [Pseudonocardiaceae bacterium]